MSVISRYLVGQYLKVFFLCLVAATGVNLIADFFEHIGTFASFDAGWSPIVSYFVLRAPKALADIYPAAGLMAVLLSVGALVRDNEMLALQSNGVSILRVASPLLSAAFVLGILLAAWNEIVVPPTASGARNLKNVEIIDLEGRGLLDTESIWMQTRKGFLTADLYDARTNTAYDVAMYELDDTFHVKSMIDTDSISWDDGWQAGRGRVITFDGLDAMTVKRLKRKRIEITATPEDFQKKRRRAYQFNYRALSHQIDLIEAKGLDANEFKVDLNFKLALPFASLVSVLLGFPLAIGSGRQRSMVFHAVLVVALSFVYWVTLTFMVSAGHSGILSPMIAAWGANVIFLMAGGIVLLRQNA